ncbi:DUF5412 family protein [Metabacillus fastidiosus]|uniref:DUF5412 family protein n=1 Tax=Metabacillus fastidiosus TaxID=1458 RepID=A0ABU6P5Z3_9BACI|nr:DUF5412 family protein [Metabacillus fastidiosus]
MKKIKLIAILIAILLTSSFLYLAYKIYSPIFTVDSCENEIVKDIPSPNGEYTAYIFKRNCGATTDVSYQLSVLKTDQELENKSGNAFITDSNFKIQWENSDHLTVNFPEKAETYEQDKKVSNVYITYKKSKE